MVVSVITFFLQTLTYVVLQIEQWEIDEGVTVGSIILWYLIVLIIFTIIGRLLGGSFKNDNRNDRFNHKHSN